MTGSSSLSVVSHHKDPKLNGGRTGDKSQISEGVSDWISLTVCCFQLNMSENDMNRKLNADI